ncbi:MAG TPA: hypothetical protein VKL22_05690 [Actinomycetota bacterium]|nr:hypothetical protein [Actinomycetota bacterium]
MLQRYDRLVNSTVAFVGALFLSVTLHELAHGLTALAFGVTPTVYAGHETHAVLSPGREAVVALAGPLFSLVSGLIVLLAPRRGRGFWRLFKVWFGVLSIQSFFGYLMTGPFVTYGDIGHAFRLLHTPGVAYVAAFVVGLLGTFALGRFLTEQLLELTDGEGVSEERAAQLRQFAFFTWIAGVVLALLLSVSSDLLSRNGIFEAAAIFTAGIPALMARIFMRRLSVRGIGFAGGVPWAGIALVAVLTVLRLTVLTSGVRL